MDLLSSVLQHFSLNAEVFFSGKLCGVQHFSEEDCGHIHLLRAGKLTITNKNGIKEKLIAPAVIFFPQPTQHSLIVDDSEEADLVCANIHYQGGLCSPLIHALPPYLHYQLTKAGLLGQSAKWIFEEANEERSGKKVILNRLCDVFLINILRQVIEEGTLKEGMMAGLAHPELSKVLVQLHQKPEANWSLASMAECCAMSRSKFAATFKQVLAQPPNDYLTDWRISVAQTLIAKNQNMDLVAHQVGYENGSALARVFRKKMGVSPKEWLTKSQVV